MNLRGRYAVTKPDDMGRRLRSKGHGGGIARNRGPQAQSTAQGHAMLRHVKLLRKQRDDGNPFDRNKVKLFAMRQST